MLAASEAELALVGVSPDMMVEQRKTDVVTGVLWFLCISLPGFVLVSASVGLSIAGVALCVGLWFTGRTSRLVRREADRNRTELELATAVFLELVNVMIAGGAGVETAVKAAAEAGDGPGFSHLRVAVMRAHSSRTSYWESLASLGHETGVDCLIEVAHTMQLAGESGARVRSSLVTKASALRKRNLARVEHAAEQSTEKMGLPLVVLFMGFLGLVGYPAFSQALSSL
jgi:Flp pilus assembly protein TadB